jgi:hypothetical protein
VAKPLLSSAVNPGDAWKRWLRNDLRDLREEMEGANWQIDGYRAVVIERFVFMTAYITRKLVENEELTVDLVERDWPIKQFRAIRSLPKRQQFRVTQDMTNWWQPVEDYYDLADPEAATLRLEDLANRLIHHFAFQLRIRAEGTTEILFNSDWSRDQLYLITLSDYMTVIEESANDEAVFFTIDKKTGRQLRHRTQRMDLI